MTEQDIFSLWPQIRTELFVFLGRPSIQLQLVVVILGLIAGAVLGRMARQRWRSRFSIDLDTAGIGRRLVHFLVIQLSSGIFAYGVIQLIKLIMGQLGARTLLIDSILRIVVLTLVLSAILAIVYTFGDAKGIRRYQNSLIVPLFVAVILVQLVGVFFPNDRLFNVSVFSLFDNTITLAAIFLTTAGFYLWLVGVNAFGDGVFFLATQYGRANAGRTQATLTLIRYLLIIVGLAYVLFRLNFNTTTIAAISGGLSVGAGFALSTILSNFVSGILLLFERTLHPGDIIEYNGIMCTVEMITIRSIRVRTFDNVEMIIPNSEFVTAPFTTYTGKDEHIRLKVPVSASYNDNHRDVIGTLMELAESHPNIMKNPAPDVRIEDFGDYSIDYQMYVWVKSPMESVLVTNGLRKSILDRFEERGITIPFPTQVEIQQDV